VPELIQRLVYLTASVPVEKFPTGAAVSSLPEGASSISGAILIGDPAQTGAMRINPRTRFETRTLASSHSAFASVPEELAAMLAEG
jgi:hypothetical protein